VKWITPENVVTIASYLMNMDKFSFQEEYQTYFDSWVFNLREALGQYLQYNNPAVKCLGLSNIEMIEYYLRILLTHTKEFINLLTDEAKAKLQEAVLGLVV
jgi:hypothetical protein